MNTCPNCGKMAGLHGSILQGCMCQYSMQAPPQRTWVGLTDKEIDSYFEDHGWSPSEDYYPVIKEIEAKLKKLNT